MNFCCVLNIEPDDRRWVIFKSYDFFIDPDPEFFNEVYAALNDTAVINKFRYELEQYDIKENFRFQQNRPITEIYNDLREANTPSIIKWAWYFASIYENGGRISSTQLCKHYNDWCKSNWENHKDTNTKTFGLNFKKYFYINSVWHGGINKKKSNGASVYEIDTVKLLSFIENKLNYVGDIDISIQNNIVLSDDEYPG